MSNNRIPLNVDHYEESSSRQTSNGTETQRFSREYRSSSNSSISNRLNKPTFTNISPVFIDTKTDNKSFQMNNMIDETERIKNRMKEFEERCRKWREEVFSKSPINDGFRHDNFNTNIDQRVPFTPINTERPVPFSSLHRSYIEDIEGQNGAKKYRIEFEIGDFKQNELVLSSNGNTLIIKGDRELVAGSTSEKKTFNREVSLPDYVDMSKITANLIENSRPVDKSVQAINEIPSFNNTLVVEAPILMDKYTYRRSGFDRKSQSPIRVKSVGRAPQNNYTSVKFNKIDSPSTDKHVESKSSKTITTTTTTSSKTTKSESESRQRNLSENRKGSTYDLNMNIDDNFKRNLSKTDLSTKQTPELISGFPAYDSTEGCVVYKFDLSGFDQNEIHLTITVDRNLEIKACKEQVDHLGKVYHEFKREIALEPEVDANLIKNILHEGILTLKIPKATKPDGLGSVTNTHSLQTPNGFREIFTDDGVLTKLNADFRGYNPENIKIVLSANNVLKVSATQHETATNNNGTVQKECTRQYTLPHWVQPENMKATMSRDGILTIDFTAKQK